MGPIRSDRILLLLLLLLLWSSSQMPIHMMMMVSSRLLLLLLLLLMQLLLLLLVVVIVGQLVRMLMGMMRVMLWFKVVIQMAEVGGLTVGEGGTGLCLLVGVDWVAGEGLFSWYRGEVIVYGWERRLAASEMEGFLRNGRRDIGVCTQISSANPRRA